MRKLSILAVAVTLGAMSAGAVASGFWLSPIYSSTSSAYAGGFNGDVKTTSYGIQGGYDFFTLGYKVTDYDFDRNDWLGKLHLLYADIHHDGGFSDGFGYFVGLGGSFGWEDDFPDEYRKEIAYVCLVFSEGYIKERYADIAKYESVIENRKEACPAPESLLEGNRRNLRQCILHSYKYILMDKDYALDIEMIRRLLHTAAPKADAVAG